MRVKYTVQLESEESPDLWCCEEEELLDRIREAYDKADMGIEDLCYAADSMKLLKVGPA